MAVVLTMQHKKIRERQRNEMKKKSEIQRFRIRENM